MRRAARVDANQQRIVDGARRVGYRVSITSTVGQGFPDLVVWNPASRKLMLIEVKDPSQPPSKRELTQDQVDFHACFEGATAVVETVEQLIEVMR